MLFSASLYVPIVAIPFLMAVFGFRPRSISVLLGMISGALTILGFNFCDLGIYLGMTNEVAPAMLMNLVVLIGSYYILPKQPNTGWVGIKERDPVMQAAQERKRKWQSLLDRIKNFRFSTYIRTIVPRDRTILLIGIYILITTNTQLFTLKTPHPEDHLNLFILLLSGGILFFIYPVLPMRPLLWNLFSYSWPVVISSLLYFLQSYLMHLYDYTVVPYIYILHFIHNGPNSITANNKGPNILLKP